MEMISETFDMLTKLAAGEEDFVIFLTFPCKSDSP
jgi:hypothetical protein